MTLRRCRRLTPPDSDAVNITVIGTGYVGLVVGACLAETGNPVVCADLDQAKIDGLKQNVLPIYEPGLDDYVARNQSQGRLRFTTDVPAAISTADVVFIAVGTPPDEDGSADLRHVLAVAEQIGLHMKRELVIVTKSTVPVGTAAKVAAAVSKHAKLPVPHVQQSRVPQGRRGDRRLHEARSRRDRRGQRPCAQRDGRAVRAVRAHRASRSSSWTSRPPR